MEGRKKALLIKLSSLGDVIFNIPLSNALKKAGYEVTWLTSEKGVEVVKNNPCIDKMIVVPFYKWKKQSFLKSFREYSDILSIIKKENYDVLVDTQGRWRSLIFSIFSGIKTRLAGSDGKELSRFGATKIVKVPKSWDINIVDKYLLYAKELGIDDAAEEMTLPDTSEYSERVSDLLNGLDSKKPLAVLAPTTTWKTKHWDKKNWKDLTEKIKDKFNLVYTGTEKNFDYIEQVRCGAGINLAGKTTLLELTELFRRADLVISLDSGSTHLARAAKVKSIIAIFCSTPENYYAPVGEHYISLAGNLECRPCHKRKCKLKNNKLACTKFPSVQEVMDSINKLFTEETL